MNVSYYCMFFQSLFGCQRLLSCVSHLLGLCSLQSKMCFSWERFHALWWRSCRHLLSGRYPESSGALEPSTGLQVRGRGAHVRKNHTSVGLIGIFIFKTWRQDRHLTSARTEERVATKVGDLHDHAIVHDTVGGLETTVHLDVAGVEVWHALQAGFTQCERERGRRHGGYLLNLAVKHK